LVNDPRLVAPDCNKWACRADPFNNDRNPTGAPQAVAAADTVFLRAWILGGLTLAAARSNCVITGLSPHPEEHRQWVVRISAPTSAMRSGSDDRLSDASPDDALHRLETDQAPNREMP
jgi:hypothetical protein